MERPYIGVSSSEAPIAFEVQVEALKEGDDARNAITAALDGLDFVVQAFDKTPALAVPKIVDDFIQPVVERRQKRIEARERTAADFLSPFKQARSGLRCGEAHRKYGRSGA